MAPPSPFPSSCAPVMGNDTATESEEHEDQEADNFEGKEGGFRVVDRQEEGQRNIFNILISDLL